MQARARELLRKWFSENPNKVTFSRHLETLMEGEVFHWITNKALHDLVREGLVVSEAVTMKAGTITQLVWPRGYRYPNREKKFVIQTIENYSEPDVSREVGSHFEALVADCLADLRFVREGRGVKQFNGAAWIQSAHDLDFVFSGNGPPFGMECKNMLGYPDRAEIRVKTNMCLALGVRPCFAVRMAPKAWTWDVVRNGGFMWIMKYALYPPHLRELVRDMRKVGLPVFECRRLEPGTGRRFLNWYAKQVN